METKKHQIGESNAIKVKYDIYTSHRFEIKTNGVRQNKIHHPQLNAIFHHTKNFQNLMSAAVLNWKKLQFRNF